MITHSIERYKNTSKMITHSKIHVIAGSVAHKHLIHQKCIENLKHFTHGDVVLLKHSGTGEEGTIINIEDNAAMAGWDGLKCKFLEVFWNDTHEMDLYHPSELIKVR